ncbi:MAG: nitrite/sulfite reductase [Lachnospiraceae bacterium]|nr:nitrite/sulfite reductase [Lachnospiraceae bacterium]
MYRIDPQSWKAEMPAFHEKTDAFYAGDLDKGAYKGFSGLYGSYAQKGGKASMLRLRMSAGRVTREKLAFVSDSIRRYDVKKAHFTTCQCIQLHDLQPAQVYPIMENALDAGIVTMGGGGDFPRNVMCSPLSGVEAGEFFDVMPYAQEAAEFALNFVKAEKMPRKLKIAFSNSPKNHPHATFRDLGFAAREDGKFDVYSAGGLGNNPLFGVKVAEAVEPTEILYYIKAMWLTFRTYGNYENRGKARTRYMQEVCGGPEGYKKAFLEKLAEVKASGEDLSLEGLQNLTVTKTGCGELSGERVIAQKQEGLYTVEWHPIGGMPKVELLCELSDLIADMEAVEMRIAPDETAYIVNLNAQEAQKVLELTGKDTAATAFEASVSCIGATICQVGVRDSQGLLASCIQAVREAGVPGNALPLIHISGCPSSCGTHQIGIMGFRGGVKKVDGKAQSGFVFYLGGNDRQGEEAMGRELGAMAEDQIPQFIVEMGQAVAASGMDFMSWFEPAKVEAIAAKYLA